jgi:hypothetical protein
MPEAKLVLLPRISVVDPVVAAHRVIVVAANLA